VASTKAKTRYRVTFMNQGEVYELYAHSVTQGGIFGFVELADLIFRESKIIDPGQERLAREFRGVPRTYVPLHAVVRIDEVEEEGEARITSGKNGSGESNIRIFPSPPPAAIEPDS